MNCPPCLECGETAAPSGYDPYPVAEAYEREDGTRCFLRGLAHVTLDGVDVSKEAREADPDTGTVILYHRNEEGKRHLCHPELTGFLPDSEKGKPGSDHVCKEIMRGEVKLFFPDNDEKVLRSRTYKTRWVDRVWEEGVLNVREYREKIDARLKTEGKIRRVL